MCSTRFTKYIWCGQIKQFQMDSVLYAWKNEKCIYNCSQKSEGTRLFGILEAAEKRNSVWIDELD